MDNELTSIQLHKASFIEAIITLSEMRKFTPLLNLKNAKLEFDIDGNDENIIIDYKTMDSIS